jgi:hypothetical protein
VWEGKEELSPVAQLQRRAIGNEGLGVEAG